jgi:hypothetical protein
MPKYKMSYAYDVPHYADFVLEAATEEEAEALANKRLEAGGFNNVIGVSSGGPEEERVFSAGEAEPDNEDQTMDELTGEGAKDA